MSAVDVAALVRRAIDEANASAPPERRIEPAAETALIGPDSGLDSLALVNLIVVIEEQVANELGIEITLVDERAMSRSRSPFRSVGTLSAYVQELVDAAG